MKSASYTDILLIGQSLEKHLTNLREVFTQLQRAGLRLKPSKYRLMKKEVEYLGHVVLQHGVKVDPKKVTAFTAFPLPKDLQSLWAFLGLMSYYRLFIPCFSSVARTLFIMTQKVTPFKCSVECETAFSHLKMLLTKSAILAYPQFVEEFLLEVDAYGVRLGAVLSQEQPDVTCWPNAFASRTL